MTVSLHCMEQRHEADIKSGGCKMHPWPLSLLSHSCHITIRLALDQLMLNYSNTCCLNFGN